MLLRKLAMTGELRARFRQVGLSKDRERELNDTIQSHFKVRVRARACGRGARVARMGGMHARVQWPRVHAASRVSCLTCALPRACPRRSGCRRATC